MPCGHSRDEKITSTYYYNHFFSKSLHRSEKKVQKSAWHLLVFIGIFEVLDYLLSPITTFKSTPMAGTPSLGLGINLKVSKFQRFQSSVNFAIFYSVMCILNNAMLHRQVFFVNNSFMLYDFYLLGVIGQPLVDFLFDGGNQSVLVGKHGYSLILSVCTLSRKGVMRDPHISICKDTYFFPCDQKIFSASLFH